jgi:hypothetical protein
MLKEMIYAFRKTPKHQTCQILSALCTLSQLALRFNRANTSPGKKEMALFGLLVVWIALESYSAAGLIKLD